MATETHPLTIIGINGDAASLPTHHRAEISRADLLVGGKRHLAHFDAFPGEKIAITGKMDALAARLKMAWQHGARVVVLASGDPLFYGIGGTLRRYFPPDALRVFPAPAAFQLAFAALGEPWHGAALLSAHARPLNTIIPQILAAEKAAILTDKTHTPAAIAAQLLAVGLPADTPCAICENLGRADERIVRSTLDAACRQTFAPLNVLVVWNSAPLAFPIPPGLPDDAFSRWRGQITKREIRLLALAELALQPGEVLWDIGAGSGAVGLEAARAQPSAAVFAVEKRAELCRHIAENQRRFPAKNYHWEQGLAPAALENWLDPHAVFIGGSGGSLAEIIAVAKERLHPGGRLVVNVVALENLHLAHQLLPDARVSQIQIQRGTPILSLTRFEPLNPVFMLVDVKRKT